MCPKRVMLTEISNLQIRLIRGGVVLRLLKSGLLREPMTEQDPPVCLGEGHVMTGMW